MNGARAMKTRLTIIGTVLALGFAGAWVERAEAAKRKSGGYPALVIASEIKEAKVHNLQNQEIGDIDEVLMEPSTGQIRFVVLNVDGFLGIGGTKVAVPWTAFQLSKEGHKSKWALDADKERLKTRPSWKARITSVFIPRRCRARFPLLAYRMDWSRSRCRLIGHAFASLSATP